ncbi:hypothetical protein [Ferruginibacter sp. HRS2-29]|uniref:gliding motility lipoprotein GldB n=1 Tax=Ferruginibacter sp. HRS2-29 TaxID=2487334 RepID=UPI0020CC0D41|nr:hypothetical protein [Ferruginibacter sp. HRS2-29]MCP9751710.1 hypothetical protein [Ferruginibacter sp. HRS2-29]
MRLLFSLVVACIFFASCNSNNTPNVDNVKVNLTTERFDKDLFAMDTTRMVSELDRLMAKYPTFGKTFLTQIINVDPLWSSDTIANYIKSFIGSYRNIYDSSEKIFADFSKYEKEIKKGMQYVKHYFPAYKLPSKVYTYIGPLDGTGDGLNEDGFCIGLQAHLGGDFSLYKTTWVQETYPDYMSRRFEPSYIAVNSMNRIVEDMFPEKGNDDKTMVMQMVEKGKRLYLLSKFLPATPEFKLIGYTEKQLKESYDHEASIWALFVQNNMLQTIDYNVIKNYVGEGPKTPELGEASPGNIGSFAGWQIVKKYMDKHSDTQLKDLMMMDAEKLFQDAKYKP